MGLPRNSSMFQSVPYPLHWYGTSFLVEGPGEPPPAAAPTDVMGEPRALVSRRPSGAKRKVPSSTSTRDNLRIKHVTISYI